VFVLSDTSDPLWYTKSSRSREKNTGAVGSGTIPKLPAKKWAHDVGGVFATLSPEMPYT
jgi:hypothetical protein